MRDLPASLDLLTLARELLLDELLPHLPPERQRDAHLIATAMAIASREARAGEGWQQQIGELLCRFYDTTSTGDPMEGLRRFAADLRNGAFETSPSRAAAARAILWRLTIEKLREANPQFLVANGVSDANGNRAIASASERKQ
jgi:hypothetical protein